MLVYTLFNDYLLCGYKGAKGKGKPKVETKKFEKEPNDRAEGDEIRAKLVPSDVACIVVDVSPEILFNNRIIKHI